MVFGAILMGGDGERFWGRFWVSGLMGGGFGERFW